MSIDTFAYYTGQIELLPYIFEPAGWAACDGRMLSISSYPVLFKLIGKTYGGDGVSTFALPKVKLDNMLQSSANQFVYYICLDGVDPSTDMATSYIGQISLFAYAQVPSTMKVCDGQLLQVSDNTTLFGLIGNDYGGDGVSNFALPRLQLPIGLEGAGQGRCCICINGVYPNS